MQGETRPDYVSGTGGGLKTKDPDHFQHLFALSRGEAWRATADEDRVSHKRQREPPDCRASHGSTPEGADPVILCYAFIIGTVVPLDRES